MPNNRVEKFAQLVRSQLNKNLLQTVLIWAATVGAFVTVLIGLLYIAQGHSVPKLVYLLTAVCSLLAAGGAWFARRVTVADASKYADEHFGLKDSVTSCRNFADDGKEGGYFDLQAKQTDTRVDRLESTKIPFAFPRRTLAIGLVFGAAAALMAFVGPSQAVKDRMALEIATADQTKSLNERLEELIEELDEEIKDEDERKLVEPEKLREWVKELHETKDQKVALRQYAKLEQKLQKASAKLEQKRDEQYLERASKELRKGKETKELAEKLEQKKYNDAAKELAKLKPKAAKELSERRKQLAKMRAASKRMASAKQQNAKRKSPNDALKKAQADAQKVSKTSSAQNSKSTNEAQKANASKGSESEPSETSEESVEELVEDLEDALEEFDGELADAEMEELDGDLDEKRLAKLDTLDGDLDKAFGKLGEKLGRMGMKKKLQSKLGKLAKACSQCQSDCAGLCESPDAGGKKAGTGASDSRRDERDDLVDNDQFTKLKGQKGSGPSIVTTEAAEDGSGVTTARGGQASRSFQRQMESFVEREDVPDDVKSGVRNYFEMIHKSE